MQRQVTQMSSSVLDTPLQKEEKNKKQMQEKLQSLLSKEKKKWFIKLSGTSKIRYLVVDFKG